MAKISVIIPVYNVENYLRECLDSVINQTFNDIEIICVNDGSTDNSPAILDEYAQKDNRIKIINKKNGGLSSARNEGLKYVTGELCYFLDSDDYINTTLFEYAVNIFEKHNIDYLCFGTEPFIENDNISQNYQNLKKYLRIKYNGLQDVDYYVGRETNIHVWNKIYKTEHLKQYNIHFINGLLYEDIYFVWYYVFTSKLAYFTPYKFHHYRLRKNSIMDDTYKTRKFDLTVSHLLNWHELFNSLQNNHDLFVKNYDYIKELLNCYIDITKDKTDNSEWSKIKDYKKKYTKELKTSYNKIFSFKEKFYHLIKNLFFVRYDKINGRLHLKFLGIKMKLRCKFISKIINNDEINVKPEKSVLQQEQKTLYEEFCKTNNNNKELLESIKSLDKFLFLPNRGNMGDIAIANACYQFFDSNNLEYDTIDMSTKIRKQISKPFNLVYGGGGLFVSYYRQYYQDILKIFRSKKLVKAVVCPVSLYDCEDVLEVFDERFTVFCRDAQSYEYAKKHNTKAKFILADDMVFGLNIEFYDNNCVNKNKLNEFISKNNKSKLSDLYNKLYPYYKSVVECVDIVSASSSKIGCFLRTDNEKSENLINIQSIIDLSLIANSFCADKALSILLLKQFLRALNKFPIIVTDRLHIGICSMLLGKKVYLIDNSYKKLSNVFNKSMRNNPNVELVKDWDELKQKLNNIDNETDIKHLELTEVTFSEFIAEWCEIKNNFGVEKIYWRE